METVIVIAALLVSVAALIVSAWQTQRRVNRIRQNAAAPPPIWLANMAKKNASLTDPEQIIRDWVAANRPLFDWVRGGFAVSHPKPQTMTQFSNLGALAAEMGIDLEALLDRLRRDVGDLGTMQLCLRDNTPQPPDLFLSATEHR